MALSAGGGGKTEFPDGHWPGDWGQFLDRIMGKKETSADAMVDDKPQFVRNIVFWLKRRNLRQYRCRMSIMGTPRSLWT